jgi:putative thioredoxin
MSYEVNNFDVEVVQKSHEHPVVVDFWAAWCGPCRVLGPVLERLEKKYQDRWALAKLDTDHHQDIAQQFGIRGIPHVKMFVDGKAVAEFTGALPEPSVVQWLEKSLPNPQRHALGDAEALLQSGREKEAEELVRRILVESPADEDARVLLARMVFPRDHHEAAGYVSGIEADSSHFAFADAVSTVDALERTHDAPASLPESPAKKTYLAALEALARNDYSTAIDDFIEVIRTDKSYDEEGARRGCIALFRILGEDSELTRAKRRDFSSALFV